MYYLSRGTLWTPFYLYSRHGADCRSRHRDYLGLASALLWILIGSIFMGAVHDFGSLMISLRHQGRSIGDIAGDLISPRVRTLFLLIICFSLWIVIAIFGVVIASVFNLFPTAVLPVWLQIPIALWLGHAVYRKGASALLAGLIAVIAMYVSVWLGTLIPLEMPAFGGLIQSDVGCCAAYLCLSSLQHSRYKHSYNRVIILMPFN